MQDLIIRNSSRLELSMRVMDVLVLETAGMLASIIHFQAMIGETAPIHTVLLHFCSGLAFVLFAQLGLYTSWRGRSMPEMFVRVAMAWGLVLLIGLFFSFLIHHVGHVSRLWLFYWYATGVMLLVAYRIIVYGTLRHLRKKGLNSKRVVIVGYGSTGQEMHRRALAQDWAGYDVKAVHADPTDAGKISDPAIVRINTVEEIHNYVIANKIHEIWITLPLVASPKMQELQYLLRNALVDIRWVPDILGLQMLSNKVGDFLGFPAVDLNQPISSGIHGVIKELFDKVFSIVALILLLPLFVVIAVCIKYTSPGPVFFKQPRLGLNGKQFNVYKFRTMKVHREQGIVTQAAKNDSRLTSIGGFLRRTSLDELPQFINVLRGEMSVVGPRPHALQHNEMYKDLLELYMLRHRVKPGITGWAQIHGHRGETDTVDKMAKRVQFDLHYIQNWSLWMDIRIIAWTAFKGWTGANAY
ncbi:undecaprenyl-phosphate glucose phosphotransferase [Noviherbaspirillum cavernae]|uniref:Undecaprenyl-phosphate glucose phosphotransferase n=1 Tax=Noviherbaspirillum cavernae TaxID=2320862 RepID=A0A418WZV6_9BURK|nr:undecaprenyl-phosphate glucose phosphotransferase [Noviherbaspirillum cavernae]RJG05777.1 undecaprenyl-phosphate glucose phosphotransferase [Noviherbaspirillum cavernae]